METPSKSDEKSEGDEVTPRSADDQFYNFWEERRVRVVKRLKLDLEEVINEEEDENNYLKLSNVVLKRYIDRKTVVRVTFVGKPGVTQNNDAVITFFGMDETAEVAFTGYRDNVKKIQEVAKVGSVLEISGFYGSKEKDGRFSNSGTGSNIKLTLLDSCDIVKVEDETIPGIPFNFVPLSDIEQRAVDELVDVRGIIVRVGKVDDYNSRDVFITDSVENTMKVSLYKDWKDSVVPEDLFKCLVLRRAAVREVRVIGRKFLRADWNTLIMVDPEMNEVRELSEWFSKVSGA